MGLGHQRAAWPLRDMAEDGIMTLGRESNTDPAEHKQWQRLRRSYEFLSRTKPLHLRQARLNQLHFSRLYGEIRLREGDGFTKNPSAGRDASATSATKGDGIIV